MDAPPPPAVTSLAGDVSIRTCDATHAALAAALATRVDVVVDCSAAHNIDVSFVQLLLSARRTAEACGSRFELSAPADGALRDVLERGGFLHPQDAEGSAEAALWTGTTGVCR